MTPSPVDRLAGSPCCLPKWNAEQILAAYERIGFSKFEAMVGWAESRFDLALGADHYRKLLDSHGLRLSSGHLSPISAEDMDATLARAVEEATMFDSLSCPLVLFKADTIETFGAAAGALLDAFSQRGLRVTPMLQNHRGSAINDLDDYRAALDAIADPRVKTVLEVGHFARVGIDWRKGVDLLGDSIALIHINEIDEQGNSVPYGRGQVDFVGLFQHLGQIGYAGDIVVELELDQALENHEHCAAKVGEAVDYLKANCLEYLR